MLAALQLKKNELKLGETNSGESPGNAPLRPVLCADSEDYTRLMKETYIEGYLASLGDSTFPSRFVNLSPEKAQLLLTCGSEFCASQKVSERAADNDGAGEYARAREVASSNAGLVELGKAIDRAIKELGQEKAFVRLSSRSPKDAPLRVAGFNRIVEREEATIEALLGSEGVLCSDNDLFRTNLRLWALDRASMKAMCVTSGEEAIALLLLSDRIRDDLSNVASPPKQSAEEPEPFNIVVRQWASIQYEFRAFVYKKKLTGLTQYNEFVWIPTLEKLQDTVLVVCVCCTLNMFIFVREHFFHNCQVVS